MISSKKATSFLWVFALANIICVITMLIVVTSVNEREFDNEGELVAFVDNVQSQYLTKEYVVDRIVSSRFEQSTSLVISKFIDFNLNQESLFERCIISVSGFFGAEYVFYHEGDVGFEDERNCYSKPTYEEFEEVFLLDFVDPLVKDFLDNNFPRDTHIIDLSEEGVFTIESRRSIRNFDGSISYKDIHYNRDIELDELHNFLDSLQEGLAFVAEDTRSCPVLDNIDACVEQFQADIDIFLYYNNFEGDFTIDVKSKKQEDGDDFIYDDFFFFEFEVTQVKQNKKFDLNIIIKKELSEPLV